MSDQVQSIANKINIMKPLIVLLVVSLIISGCTKDKPVSGNSQIGPFNPKPGTYIPYVFTFRQVNEHDVYLLEEIDLTQRSVRIISDTITKTPTVYIDANEYIASENLFFSILIVDDESKLRGIDVNNGEVVSELGLNTDNPFLGLKFDYRRNLFYAIESGDFFRLVSIDPYTLEINVIYDTFNGFDYIPGDYKTVYCEDINTYAFISSDLNNKRLWLIDVNTGNLIDSFPLTGNYKGLAYIPYSNKIFSFKVDGDTCSFGFFDLNSGEFTLLKDQFLFGSLNQIAFHPEKGEYAIIYNGDTARDHLLLYDIENDSLRDIMAVDDIIISINYK